MSAGSHDDQAEAELLAKFDGTTQRYFGLLARLRQAVIATDVGGSIIFWSGLARQLYGWPAREVLGKNILDVTPTELSRTQGVEIMQALTNGEVWSGEFRVQTRAGRSFLASVTDVPLLSEANEVVGVIGISAPSHAPTRAAPVMKSFVKACNAVWPRQIASRLAVPKTATVNAAEPHLLQLLSLLILLYVSELDRDARLNIAVKAADNSPFADFGLAAAATSPALYVRIAHQDERATYSVLRTVSGSAESTRYASALVRMVGGMLIAGTAPGRPNSMHLFLPVA